LIVNGLPKFGLQALGLQTSKPEGTWFDLIVNGLLGLQAYARKSNFYFLCHATAIRFYPCTPTHSPSSIHGWFELWLGDFVGWWLSHWHSGLRCLLYYWVLKVVRRVLM
jgi:hypothetical protein